MKEELVKKAYDIALERYAAVGVDANEAIEKLQKISLSLHCWQADDVTGFENPDGQLLAESKLQVIIRVKQGI